MRKAELFAQAVDEDWIVVLSHEAAAPDRPAGARPRPLPVRGRLGPSQARGRAQWPPVVSGICEEVGFPFGYNQAELIRVGSA